MFYIARSVNLMEHMSMQHFLWKSELRKARHNVFTAPGKVFFWGGGGGGGKVRIIDSHC